MNELAPERERRRWFVDDGSRLVAAERDRRQRAIGTLLRRPHISAMSIRSKWHAWGRLPMVRQGLFILGCLMVIVSPVVGLVPGPGGIIVFGFGLGLVLKYSDWAKRRYVAFKRRHPNKGRWADWGLRRRSAKRREARLRGDGAEGLGVGD